ncbi:GntR family transcriptional regulator [Vagococcus silagei]|uniref:GntR family transcriptional regulator n=1 Tax=Vagococcus silagei TaxID=2508885 RepID=A0A4S3BAJ3_9ENTE|nr:GntR family transcriptional regulator [Vagococcus silagei]THB62375.1 GntR family transcriptional regulator [Vagococcus silagei]
MEEKKQSLYGKLVDTLRETIKTEMKPHDLLPSERDLSEIYGVSRTTVRLALQELEHLGYIYKRHGKGTFVSSISDNVMNLSGTYSFTEQMKTLGRTPETKIISFEEVEANQYFAEHLGVFRGVKIIKIKRLRLADGKPMMLERSYLPKDKFDNLTIERLEGKSLYDVFLNDYQQVIRYAEEEFYASLVNRKDAEWLDIPEGSPSLNMIRQTYNTSNEVVEYTLSVARADQFRYRISHNRIT